MIAPANSNGRSVEPDRPARIPYQRLDNGPVGSIVFVCINQDLAREMRAVAFRAICESEPLPAVKDYVDRRRAIVVHLGPEGRKEHTAGFLERECYPDRVGVLDLAEMGFNRPADSFAAWWMEVDGTDRYEHGGVFNRQAELRAKWRPRRLQDQGGGGDGLPIAIPLGPLPDREVPLTDLGNAERLVHRAAGKIRYCKPWKKWLAYDGRRWRPDDTMAVERFAKIMVRGLLEEAAAEPDDKKRKEIAAWQGTSESRARIEAAIALAASEEGVPAVPDQLDRDPWLLNVENGTIDLRAGELRPHKREDLITCLAPVAFDPDATCPLWLATLDRVFDGRPALIGFIQRLFGLALTGAVTEQVLPIFHGHGSNGKSTILGALIDLLGPDYAIVAPPGLLMLNRGESHPTRQATLFGKRLVVDMETAEGAKLNEALVKQLTGSDKISARRMREDFWEFTPTHKLILCSNHKPEIRGTEHAIWRRIRLVPFDVTIPDHEQDRSLPQKLQAEFRGILAWCVRGCLDWRRDGLNPPDDVVAATAEYRADQDILGDFLASECMVNPSLFARASALYQRYRKWTEGSGEQAVNQRAFGKALVERGFQRYTNNGTCYSGIGLRSDDTDNPY
jgi:putative DNA primase/helicase